MTDADESIALGAVAGTACFFILLLVSGLLNVTNFVLTGCWFSKQQTYSVVAITGWIAIGIAIITAIILYCKRW